jgi:hypothetical protein
VRKLATLLALPLLLAACGGTETVAPDVGGDVVKAELAAAGVNLATWYQVHGTYLGAAAGVPGVTLVRADATTWCLQTATSHEAGPGGPVLPGAC